MSRKLKGFQVANLSNGFVDNLNDSSIHSNWTVDITDISGDDPTITEDDTGLTISYVGGNSVNVDWYISSPVNAPNINLTLKPMDFMAKVFIDNFSAVDTAGAGIAHYLGGDKSKCHVINIEDSLDIDYIRTHYNFSDDLVVGSPFGSCWIALARRGYSIKMFYSLNAFSNEPALADMVYIRSFDHAFGYTNNKLALFAMSRSDSYPSISPRFRKFSLVYSI